MVFEVRLLPRAERDLEGIYEYIGAAQVDQALMWYLGLRKEILSLETLPNRCPVAPEGKGLRHLLYGNKPHAYRVIYRIIVDRRVVEVLHIRHGAMDASPVQAF